MNVQLSQRQILDRLRQVPLVAHLNEDELQCLANGTVVELSAGAQIAQQGDSPDGFYIILEGATEWTRRVGQQEAHAVTLEAGDVFAELILLLDEPYPTTGRAITDVQLYKLEPDAFWEMLSRCPKILRDILKISAQRSQIHEAVTQQQAKLISLGTLSAGLAHELNNPAAAVQRGLQQLQEVWQRLHQQPLPPDQVAFLNQYQHALTNASLDPIAQSELEDAVTDWLEDHHVHSAWQLAPTLVTAGITIEELEKISASVPDLNNALSWLEASLTGDELLETMKTSAERISRLVTAMKDYSYLDRAPLQEVDVHEGLESTLTILSHKLRSGVEVKREYGNLPPICAYSRQLNQVWTHLIDNAIDATGRQGHIWLRTTQESDRLLVEIADDGVGIPPEIAPRIFEQFFTTKEVGKIGLGLDIARRIVNGHKGTIRFESEPGNTRFQVRLPLN